MYTQYWSRDEHLSPEASGCQPVLWYQSSYLSTWNAIFIPSTYRCTPVSCKGHNSQQDEESIILIRHLRLKISGFCSSITLQLNTPLPFHTHRKNPIPLTNRSFSWCISPQSGDITFFCCHPPITSIQTLAIDSCGIQRGIFPQTQLEMLGHFFCKCENNFEQNQCNEKPKLSLMLTPGNLLSLIFNASCKKGK